MSFRSSEHNLSRTGPDTPMGMSFHAGRMAAAAQRRDVSHADLVNYERLFDTFDVDQVGYLDAEAIQFLLRCLGIQVENENLDQLLDLFDTSGNGLIDFEEFVSLMNRIGELDTKRTITKEEEINHVSKFTTGRFTNDRISRWFWDTLILCISGYYCFRVVLEYYLVPDLGVLSVVFESILTAILLCDVCVMANTAYKDKNGTNVVDQKQVLFRYLRTTFIFDILGALPIDLIYYFAAAQPHAIWGVRACRSLRFFRIVRIGSTLFLGVSFSGVWTPRHVKFTYNVAPLLRSVFILIIMLNMVVTGWLILRREVGKEMSYDEAMYFILYTVTTVGFSDQEIDTPAERIYCMVLFLCGLVVNGIVISNVSAFLSKADIATERSDKMRETLAVLEHFEIPPEVQSEILSFQSHILEHNLGSSHASLISNLPQSIQESLALFMKVKYISMVPMFCKASQECKLALAQSLVNVVYRPQEFIIVAGERGREMYFLGHGVANVIHPTGIYLATLRKGNFFGEFALLVEEAHRTASIKALTYCDVFRLEKDSFVQIMTKFPTFRDTMKEEMEDRVQQFQKQNNAIIPNKKHASANDDANGNKMAKNSEEDGEEANETLGGEEPDGIIKLKASEQLDKLLSKEHHKEQQDLGARKQSRMNMMMDNSMAGSFFRHRSANGNETGVFSNSTAMHNQTPTSQSKYQTGNNVEMMPMMPMMRRSSGLGSTHDLPRFDSTNIGEASGGSPWTGPSKFGASFGESFHLQPSAAMTPASNLPSKRGDRVKFQTPSSPTAPRGGVGGEGDQGLVMVESMGSSLRPGPPGFRSSNSGTYAPDDGATSILMPSDSGVVLEGLAHLADPAMGGGSSSMFERRASVRQPPLRSPTTRQQNRAAIRTAMNRSRQPPSTQNPFHFGEQVESNAFFPRTPPNEEVVNRRFVTQEYEDLLLKMKRLEKFVEERTASEEQASKSISPHQQRSPSLGPQEQPDGTHQERPPTIDRPAIRPSLDAALGLVTDSSVQEMTPIDSVVMEPPNMMDTAGYSSPGSPFAGTRSEAAFFETHQPNTVDN